MDLLRLFRTVRYLKPAQVFGRLVHALPRPQPRRDPAPAPRAQAAPWTPAIEREPSLIGPTKARFLNDEGDIDSAAGWNDPSRAKLWLYNLHYFDELAAAGNAARTGWRRTLVERWIAENPLGTGVGWEPYPTSLRIVNWIKWAMGGAPLEPHWRDSLAVQTRWLAGRIEWRLLGNHLLANAKALIFAGLYFEGPEAEGWLAKGLKLHRRQLEEQMLADGGHFERSPMYQAILLEDLLDLINLGRASGAIDAAVIADWARRAERMDAWLAAMTHPDGQIGFFNDAAFDIAPAPGALNAYAQRLGVGAPPFSRKPIHWLRASGYARLSEGEAVAIIDAAPIGPDYLPGHAHADTLSFEWSVGVERIVVNGGTSVYGEGPQRQLERATAAHSTVEIDGENSSEVWAGFRVGRRARVRDITLIEDADGASISAAHDGYAWKSGRPRHRRSWRLGNRRLTVVDTIEGRASNALTRFHFGPNIDSRIEANGCAGDLIAPSGRVIHWTTSAPARLAPSQWRPRFGVRMETRQLMIPIGNIFLKTEFFW